MKYLKLTLLIGLILGVFTLSSQAYAMGFTQCKKGVCTTIKLKYNAPKIKKPSLLMTMRA